MHLCILNSSALNNFFYFKFSIFISAQQLSCWNIGIWKRLIRKSPPPPKEGGGSNFEIVMLHTEMKLLQLTYVQCNGLKSLWHWRCRWTIGILFADHCWSADHEFAKVWSRWTLRCGLDHQGKLIYSNILSEILYFEAG
jgi:hypothetical protein